MQELHITIGGSLPMTRERVIRLVRVANSFSSQVILEGDSITINGKSMLGLLSINWGTGREFTLITRGEDEGEALRCLAELLSQQDAPENAES